MTAVTTEPPFLASRKRMFLALYLDLILFLVVWGLVKFLVGGDAHFGAGVIVFAVVRFATWKLSVSPGRYFLSIGRDRMVDADIYRRESWSTMLLGAVFVLEGTKPLVNWTRGVIPEPIFGSIPGDTAQVTIDMLSGALLVFIGFLYLKLRALGFWLAIFVVVASLGRPSSAGHCWLKPFQASCRRGGRRRDGRHPTAKFSSCSKSCPPLP